MPDIKTIITIVHIFGVALGAGGAFMTDAIFLSSARDERFSATELRLFQLGGRMIWGGLAVLALSGVGLFMGDPAAYLVSSKFLAKVTIVAIIVVNGIALHAVHIPLLLRYKGEHYPSSDEFARGRIWLLASGGVSMVSWCAAVVLGSLRDLPFVYGEIMTAYAVLVAAVVASMFAFRDVILPHHSAPPLFRRLRKMIFGE